MSGESGWRGWHESRASQRRNKRQLNTSGRKMRSEEERSPRGEGTTGAGGTSWNMIRRQGRARGAGRRAFPRGSARKTPSHVVQHAPALSPTRCYLPHLGLFRRSESCNCFPATPVARILLLLPAIAARYRSRGAQLPRVLAPDHARTRFRSSAAAPVRLLFRFADC